MKSSVSSRLLRKEIAGIPCDFPSHEEFLVYISDRFSAHNTLSHIVTLNAEMVVEAQHNKEFRQAIMHSELIIPDGGSMLWAKGYTPRTSLAISLIRFLFSQEQPLTGVDSILDICEELEKQHGSLHLLGGTSQEARGTAQALHKKYPALTISILSDEDATHLQPTVYNLPSPSALLVAYGAPKQTFWIEQHRTQLERSGIRIAMGVGGAFTILSGILPRAPKIMRRFHVEWLWRLLLQPKRIRRIWNAVVIFPLIISKQVIHID